MMCLLLSLNGHTQSTTVGARSRAVLKAQLEAEKAGRRREKARRLQE